MHFLTVLGGSYHSAHNSRLIAPNSFSVAQPTPWWLLAYRPITAASERTRGASAGSKAERTEMKRVAVALGLRADAVSHGFPARCCRLWQVRFN